MSDLGERFRALQSDAQAEKDAGVARILPLLAEIDSIMDELRGKGIAIRAEAPIGRAARMAETRFVSEFYARLA